MVKQIRRELLEMLLRDKNLHYTILPEASLGTDRYLSSFTTVSDVEVSDDLQVVKVYVSVFSDERGGEVDIAGLKSKAKDVRSELGRRIKLRLTPEIRSIEDESLERGSREDEDMTGTGTAKASHLGRGWGGAKEGGEDPAGGHRRIGS